VSEATEHRDDVIQGKQVVAAALGCPEEKGEGNQIRGTSRDGTLQALAVHFLLLSLPTPGSRRR